MTTRSIILALSTLGLVLTTFSPAPRTRAQTPQTQRAAPQGSEYLSSQPFPKPPSNGGLLGNGSTSLNWTGYVVTSRDNHNSSFTQVEGQWTVPATNPQVQGSKSVYTWVGLGGDRMPNPQSTVLWQAGTARLPDSCHSYAYHWVYDYYTGSWHYVAYCTEKGYWDQGGMAPRVYHNGQYMFWYEDYGCRTAGPAPCPNAGMPVYLDKPVIHAGDHVYLKVNAVTGLVYLENMTTSEVVTLTVSIDNSNVGTSAEWIVEETGDGPQGCSAPSYACTYVPFSDPGFSSAYAYGTGMSTYADIFNYRRYDLIDANRVRLTQPPPINSTTHGFSITCCAR